MIFTYMNIPEVFQAFCAVYEAVYAHMGAFDQWYTNGVASSGFPAGPRLQDEWRTYINTVLSSAETRTRATFDLLYSLRRYVGTLPIMTVRRQA